MSAGKVRLWEFSMLLCDGIAKGLWLGWGLWVSELEFRMCLGGVARQVAVGVCGGMVFVG